MAPEKQLERSMLDGKDREELHAIASAIGVKGVTRLKKADLVDAILTASGNDMGFKNLADVLERKSPGKIGRLETRQTASSICQLVIDTENGKHV